MTQLLEKLEKLNAARRQSVEDYADRLLDEQTAEAAEANPETKRKIDWSRWEGCLAHVDQSKSNKEVLREGWDAVIEKLTRD